MKSKTELREEAGMINLLGGAIGGFIFAFAIFACVTTEKMTTLWRVKFIIGAVVVAVGFYLVLRAIHWLQNIERRADFEEERRVAQYNKFMELLRDVRWNLTNRNGL